MMTFLATVHFIACIALIIVAMLQDSKGGGLFSSQTSSNSVLGATGGATLAVTVTKVLSVIIVITCVSIAMVYTKSSKSVIDSSVMAVTAPVNAAPAAAASADQTKSK
jgi:preprotein translocase subunit SecG